MESEEDCEWALFLITFHKPDWHEIIIKKAEMNRFYMATKKYAHDWELVCTGCKEKYFKVRGKSGKSILAKCKSCGKVMNVKTMKIKHVRT